MATETWIENDKQG